MLPFVFHPLDRQSRLPATDHSHPERFRKVMRDIKRRIQEHVPAAPATTALTIFVEYLFLM
jgi:hypothetical protein